MIRCGHHRKPVVFRGTGFACVPGHAVIELQIDRDRGTGHVALSSRPSLVPAESYAEASG